MTPGRVLLLGQGALGIPTHPAPSPLRDPPSHVLPEAVCWCGWLRGTVSHQSRPLHQAAPNRRAPGYPPSLLSPAVFPSTRCSTRGRRRSGRQKRGGESEWAERRAAEGGGGAATWYHGRPGAPEPMRARASLRLGQRAGGAGGGAAGEAGGASRGRSEGWEDACELAAGEWLPHQHLPRPHLSEARRTTDDG